jgi:type 1 glutamine amidotransferase
MCALAAGFAALGVARLTAVAAESPSASDSPHVVFVVGEGEYGSQESMPALADVLSTRYGLRVTVLIDSELDAGPDNSIGGLNSLETADLAIFFMRFRQLPDTQLAEIQRYLDRGGPVVASRTTTHAFAYDAEDPRAEKWNAFGARELGAPWIHHYGHDASADATTEGEHPTLNGVPSSFHVRSWTYHVLPDYPPQTANVLVRGRPVLPEEDAGDDTVNPIAWTTEHTGGGRVFMTTMGHPEDFTVPAFRRLVVNGIHWALGREAPDVAVPGWRVGASSPWVDMDFGPFLSTAIQTAHDDVTYKGLVIPLTEDRHGASTVFDTDLLRFSAGWTDGFIHWEGIVWDGSHGTFPSVAGDLAWTTPEGPGWASEGRFDDPRKQPFGPLPRQWAHWHGVRLDGDEVVLTYSVGTREVRETPTFAHVGGLPTFIRTLTVSPGEQPLTMRVVATRDQPRVEETNHSQRSSWLAVANGAASGARLGAAIVDAPPGVRLAGGESCLLALIPASDLSVSFSVAIAASYNADARATWLDALGSVPADGRTTSNTA